MAERNNLMNENGNVKMIDRVIAMPLNESQWKRLNGVMQPKAVIVSEGESNGLEPIGNCGDLEMSTGDFDEDPPIQVPNIIIVCLPCYQGQERMESAIQSWVDEGYEMVGSIGIDTMSSGNDELFGTQDHQHFYCTMKKAKDREPNVTIYGGEMDGLIVTWGTALRLWGRKMINKPTLDGVVNTSSKGDKASLEMWQNDLQYANLSEEL